MHLHGLYAITDNRLTPSPVLLDNVEQALRGGAQILQYRDKTNDSRKRLQEALALKDLCASYHCYFIINDDIDLCAASGADGVHLGLSDSNIIDARNLLGPKTIIGATCHGSLELAQQAVSESADYVAFGRFFSSNTKPNAPLANLESVSRGLKNLSVPAVAIGGITLNHADQLIESGFSMLAVIEDIFKLGTITSQCEAYQQAFARHD
ncbi:thiamine-phosphate diphosphorylase [Gammaproteobacteria bacterium 45_16_T64]|nr:thiamine-phosphate diphosphorylase [Gammaproteobacteria bacterium 45_16_T64]